MNWTHIHSVTLIWAAGPLWKLIMQQKFCCMWSYVLPKNLPRRQWLVNIMCKKIMLQSNSQNYLQEHKFAKLVNAANTSDDSVHCCYIVIHWSVDWPHDNDVTSYQALNQQLALQFGFFAFLFMRFVYSITMSFFNFFTFCMPHKRRPNFASDSRILLLVRLLAVTCETDFFFQTQFTRSQARLGDETLRVKAKVM